VHRVYIVQGDRECEKYTACTRKGIRVTLECTESVYKVNIKYMSVEAIECVQHVTCTLSKDIAYRVCTECHRGYTEVCVLNIRV
jgi:hypothetical protein